MPFDWSQLLELAKELSASDTREAVVRTSVGRAYYFVYHASLDKARSSTPSFTGRETGPEYLNKGSHARLWDLVPEKLSVGLEETRYFGEHDAYPTY